MKSGVFIFTISAILLALSSSCVTVPSAHEETYYATEYVMENRTEPFTEMVDMASTITGEDVISPCISWGADVFTFKAINHVWYHGYDLSGLPSHENETIRVIFSRQQFYEYTTVSIFNMAPRGQILAPPAILASDERPPAGFKREFLYMKGDSSTFQEWLDMANFKLNYALFLGGKADLWLNYEGPCTIECNTRGAKDIAVIISGPTLPQNMRFSVIRAWSDTCHRQIMRTGERTVSYPVEKKIPRQRVVSDIRRVPFWEIWPGK